MKIEAFNEDFDHCKKKLFCRTPFVEQFFYRASLSRTSLEDCFYKIKDNLIL